MDAQLADPLAHRFRIASMAIREPVQSRGDERAYPLVLEPRPPFAECFGLLKLKRITYVVFKLLSVNRPHSRVVR